MIIVWITVSMEQSGSMDHRCGDYQVGGHDQLSWSVSKLDLYIVCEKKDYGRIQEYVGFAHVDFNDNAHRKLDREKKMKEMERQWELEDREKEEEQDKELNQPNKKSKKSGI